jgi:hypothetical protein
MKLLHIGLGKCGSTFLQREIFPKVAKKIKINYIDAYKNNFYKINENKINFHVFENFQNIEKLLPRDFIISCESLFSYGWEFSRIEKSFNYIKNNFSSDTIILIVIRNPYDLLNSIYCQTISGMRIIEPKKFFYIDAKEINIRLNDKFNLYNFDYSKLISLYKSYFKEVVIVKHENLHNLDFLKNIFHLDDETIEELKKIKIIYNKSISKFGINFILFLNNFFDLEKNQLNIQKLIKPSNKIIDKIKNKILSQFLLRGFFQSKFDRIIPYKKYCIKKEYIPIFIEKEIFKYKKL